MTALCFISYVEPCVRTEFVVVEYMLHEPLFEIPIRGEINRTSITFAAVVAEQSKKTIQYVVVDFNYYLTHSISAYVRCRIKIRHCYEMYCCFIVTGSSCNSIVRAKYRMHSLKNLFLIGGQRKLLTNGPGSQETILKQCLGKFGTFTAIERTRISATKSYLPQNRRCES